jgi:hypothetical protein
MSRIEIMEGREGERKRVRVRFLAMEYDAFVEFRCSEHGELIGDDREIKIPRDGTEL